jgi:hypothetical protein
LGFYENNLEPKVKASLFQTFVRPSLMYGNEASLLSKEEEKSLCKVEGNILKQALNVSKCSYSTELYHAVTLDFTIRKRKISFILQIINNSLTNKILASDKIASKTVLGLLGLTVDSEHMDEALIRVKCQEVFTSLREKSKRNEESRFTMLLKNRMDSRVYMFIANNLTKKLLKIYLSLILN